MRTPPKKPKRQPIQRKVLRTTFQQHQLRSVAPDSEEIREMLAQISKGIPPSAACGIAQILPSTFSSWIEWGFIYLNTPEFDRNPEIEALEPFGVFYLELEKAKGIFQKNAVERMIDPKNAAMWRRDLSILERRAKEDWAAPTSAPVKESIDRNIEPDESFL